MELRNKAEELAARYYFEIVRLDETTEGEPVYLAFSPELENCLGQGKNPDEALDDLRQARIDFILSLLEDNLPVPEPQASLARTGAATINITNQRRPYGPDNRWHIARQPDQEANIRNIYIPS
ncbi:MAG: type II toxin-antitoxin system HicB family antitoxin [Anaerolineales bacterium]|nr:type II toxin-antitoxin system HicB family antitoxin [Anaerolineales bacterium]